jgi:hypothetical protein
LAAIDIGALLKRGKRDGEEPIINPPPEAGKSLLLQIQKI